MSILAFVILLPIIVFVHELGHFLFARWCGVRVIKFSIGFGKSLYSWTDSYGTIWSISMIPFGGFVSMLGQNDAPETIKQKQEARAKLTETEKAESFEFKKRYQKIAIAFGGPLFNFIFGFIVFLFIFSFKGIPEQKISIVEILKNSPAISSGLKVGDEILEINGNALKHTKSILKIERNNILKIKRNNKIVTIPVNAEKKGNSYFLGMKYTIESANYKKIGFTTAVCESGKKISDIVTTTIKGVGEMITGTRSSKELGGMISIAKISGSALSNGFYSFMYLMAIISVSLGLFNLFPIPILDGGQIFIILIESIIRHDLPDIVKSVFYFIGLAAVIFLMLLSNANDVIRWWSAK